MIKQEARIRKTMLSKKPSIDGARVALSLIFFMALMTAAYWASPLGYLLPAIPSRVFDNKEFWRVFTAIGIHGDMKHFLSNAYMLGILSYLVSGYFGLLVHPILCCFLSGIVNFLSLLTYPPDVQLLGASGLVYLLAGFWLTCYTLIERRFRFSTRVIRAVGVGLIILFPETFEPSVSYRTHTIGFIMGLLFATTYFFTNKKKIRSAEVIEMIPTESFEDPPPSYH